MTEYLPPRLRASTAFGLVERDLLCEVNSRNGSCPDDAELLAEALCRVKPQHVTAAVARLRQARLIEVVLDVDDARCLRVTELGQSYWVPPEEPLYGGKATAPLLDEGRCDPASVDAPALDTEGTAMGEPDLPCPARADALALDFAFYEAPVIPKGVMSPETDVTGVDPGVTECAPEEKTRAAWQIGIHDAGTYEQRARDGPASLRNPSGGLARAIVAERQGGYRVPPDLSAVLPAEVVLALNRGEPCIPMKADKKPLVRWKEYQERTPTPQEVRRWVLGFGADIAGWARVTGRISGLIVLDDDGGGWFEKWGLAPHVLTGNGGFHWIGEYPGWRVKTLNCVTSRQLGEAFPQLDIRADGGYSIIAGFSVKGGYTCLREPKADPLDLLPQSVRRFFGLEHAPKQSVKPHDPGPPPKAGERVPTEILVTRAVRIAASYGRNNAAFALAIQVRDNGYSQAECEGLYSLFAGRVGGSNAHGDSDPFTEEEWCCAIRSAYSQSPREPWPKTPDRH